MVSWYHRDNYMVEKASAIAFPMERRFLVFLVEVKPGQWWLIRQSRWRQPMIVLNPVIEEDPLDEKRSIHRGRIFLWSRNSF